MTSQPIIPRHSVPFFDELFVNSPLCQICLYANLGIGGVCSLLLNRRVPSELRIKNSQIITCGAHRNWIKNVDFSDS